jgi:hypothetical protein
MCLKAKARSKGELLDEEAGKARNLCTVMVFTIGLDNSRCTIQAKLVRNIPWRCATKCRGSARRGDVGGVDDDLALRTDPYAFGANAGKSLKGQVNNAAFAGVHGI